VTNSSLVVPVGSFQSENGVNLSARDGGQTIDGTNSRWRLGIAPCLEVLVDLPTFFANVKVPGSSEFTDVARAVKWQRTTRSTLCSSALSMRSLAGSRLLVLSGQPMINISFMVVLMRKCSTFFLGCQMGG
jgi:hypothetical protein